MEKPEQCIEKFLELRMRIFNLIDKSLETDNPCKNYEGELLIHFPNFFQEYRDGCKMFFIQLNCSVIGGDKKTIWEGTTFQEVVECMSKTVIEWEKYEN